VIGFPQADVRVRVRAAETDEYRLVRQDEAILIAGHVFGGQDGDDARQGLGRACIHRQHAGVGLAAEENAAVQ
jgi:hypothetical protein